MPTGGTTDATTDWGKLYTIISSTGTGSLGLCGQSDVYDRIRCALKMPLSGALSSIAGNFYLQGSEGYYWSSSPSGYSAYNVDLHADDTANTSYSFSGAVDSSSNRANGYSVRCIRN